MATFARSQLLRFAIATFVLLLSPPLTRTQSVCNRQAVVYVTATGSATGCCGTSQRPCGSLDLALTNADLKGATILLVNGTIPVSFSTLSSPLALGGYSLTIAAGSLSSPSPTPPASITSKPLIDCKNGPCLSAVCASNGGASAAAPAVPCAQASVTIQGVVVMSGLNKVGGGGCLEAANQKVTITSVDFSSCIAYTNGGAVSVSSSKDVTMTNVTVFDSKVTQGGIDGGGGGIAIFSSKGSLSALDVESCHADESVGGGIAIYSSTLTLSSSVIAQCSSRFLGGGLASSTSTLTLKSVQITSTNASSAGCLSDTASLSLSIQASTFFGCFAASSRDYPPYDADPSYGGGMFLNGTTSTVILDSTIDSTTSVYGGGGIYAMGTTKISIQRSTITRCTNYMDSGTGVAVDGWSMGTTTGSVELIDSQIVDNTGYAESNLGVGVYLSDVNAVVRGCNISGNNGLMTEGLLAQGGGISTNFVNKEEVVFDFSDSTVSNNWAYMGGGLYITSPAVTVTNVTFANNYAVASGGGVYWLNGGSMVKSRVEGNVGAMGGGGMAVNTKKTVAVDDCDFIANEATTGEGGGVLITEGEATDVAITNSRFSQNKAMAARGGAIFHSGTALSLFSTSFRSNSAAKGGAVAVVGSILSSPSSPSSPSAPSAPPLSTVATITSSSFSLNHADLSGGALYAAMTGDARITDCELAQNDATTGGGIALEEYSVLALTRSVCDGNKAVSGGGCLALIDATSGVIVKGEVKGNAGGSEGGGVRASGSARLTVTGVIVEGNSAEGGGGFVWAEMDAQVNATGTNFRNNSARFYGGVIYAVHSARVDLTGSNLVGNSADLGGAALIEGRAVLSCLNSTFSSNAAHAVVVRGQAEATILGGSFNNNTAASGPSLSSSSSSSSTSSASAAAVADSPTATATATATGFSDFAYPSPSIHMAAAFAAAVTSSIEAASLATRGPTARLLAATPAAAGAGNVTTSQGGNRTVTTIGVASPLGDGGALRATDSAILVINSSTLTGNTASKGGAIFSDSLASVSINSCDFISNVASKGAGALATGNSSLSVLLSNFTANAASFGGGGLFYEGNSQGSILNCSFVGNDAKKGGAAVYVDRELLRKNPLGETSVSDANSTSNSNSDGSGSGSGSQDTPSPTLPPAMVALSSNLTCDNVVFEGNAAVPSQGVAFFDTSFWPGVRITCSGADSTKNDTIGTPPTSFSLLWQNNALEGGSTDNTTPFTVMGDTQTPIVNISVTILDAYGNIAIDDFSSIIAIQPDPRISGLLRATALEGQAVLPPVSLVMPPESATNFTLPITVSSPTDAYPPITQELEFAFCDPGNYFSLDSLACLPCEVGYMCPAGQGSVVCEDGTFSFLPAASECVTCADTVTILGDNAMGCSNGTCTIAGDFWLNPESVYTDSPAVYYCDVSNGCAGYNYSSPNDSQCAEGYDQNRLCSTCSPGYYSVISTCYQCTSWMETLFWFFFVLVILLWVATAVFSDRFHSVSMMNSELQILAVLGSVDLQFPDWARKVVELSTLSLFSVDILGPDCKFTFPFTSRWALTMIVAAVGLAAYALLFAAQRALRLVFPLPSQSHAQGGEKGGEKGGKKPSANPPAPLEDIYIHGAANWLDVCYLPVTVRCFQAFSSSTYDVQVMTFSPTDLWSSSARITLFAIGITVTVIFVAGAPIYYALTMLYGKKRKLLDTRAFRTRWGWMVTRYEYRYFYWHLMLFARRLLVAALFVFLIDSPPVQMTILFPVQVILIGLQLAASPFVASTHDAFAAILIVAEMIFIIATMGFNFVQLETLPKIGFALVIMAFCIPTLIVFSYETTNHLLVWKVHGAAKSLWALDDDREGGDGGMGGAGKIGKEWGGGEKGGGGIGGGAASNKPRSVREGAVEVSPSDVLDWFRPHIAAIILLPGREEERRLLMKVRRAYEACCYPLTSPSSSSSSAAPGANGDGPSATAPPTSSSKSLVPAPEFGDIAWIKDLNKSQLFAALHQIVLGAAVGRRPVARVPFDARDVPAIWTTSGGLVIAGMGAVPTAAGSGGAGIGAQESDRMDIADGSMLSSRYGHGSTSFYNGGGGVGSGTRVHDILASSRFISKAMRENAKTDRPALVRSTNISIKNLRPPKPPQPLPQDLWPPPLEECATWAHVIGRQQAAQLERDGALAEGREEEEEEEDEGAKEEMAGAPAGYGNGSANGGGAAAALNGDVEKGGEGGEGGEEDGEEDEVEGEDEEEEEGEYLEAWLDSMGISLAFQQSFSQLTLVEKKRKPQSLRRLLTSVKLRDILGWLSSPLCTTADRALFVRLLAAVRAATVEDAGGPRWSKCLVVAFQGKPNATRKVAAASKDYLAEASENTLAEASQEDSGYGYGV
ncbi:hypothetical protein CLOM_g17620 [Closterium sp. NIES-68]|nr:hypothetical protein CLOM_g17620 [Closterium sp. NIES-68]GJP70954.1 hypothetical protein CLOP_g1847 [Closterium sp. NIES-67]